MFACHMSFDMNSWVAATGSFFNIRGRESQGIEDVEYFLVAMRGKASCTCTLLHSKFCSETELAELNMDVNGATGLQ